MAVTDSTTNRPEPVDQPDVILAGLLDGAGHASCDSCSSVMRSAHGLIVDQQDRLAAAYDVIRRLRDGWRPGKNMAVVMAGSPRPDPVPIWMSPSIHRDSEPMTPAERAVLGAVAGPDDTEENP